MPLWKSLGNTIGVGALGEFLAKIQFLKVRKTNYHPFQSRSKKYHATQVADFADIFAGRLISEIP